MVSAWGARLGLVLGQVQTEQKSNEITAIPRLVELLQLKGAVVTIDAAGCQKEIAAKIVNRGADYMLAVKDNHPPPRDAVHHEQASEALGRGAPR